MSAPFFSSFFLGLNQLIFHPKWCHVGLASTCHFFGLGPSSKRRGSNLWLSSNRIGLFHWALDFEPSSKVQPCILGMSYYTSGLVFLVCCPFCFVDSIETFLGSDSSVGKGSVLSGYQLLVGQKHQSWLVRIMSKQGPIFKS
jgi:hypothetical protein